MQRLKAWWAKYAQSRRSRLVCKLISGIAGLEIERGDYRRLAPVRGVYGTFRIEGNSLPTITYQVFDKTLMEFVKVTAALALPASIVFEAVTEDLGRVPIKKAYTGPFHTLASHLVRYFPLPMPEKPKELTNGVN